MNNREERIKLRSQTNRVQTNAPAFLAALSEILGESVDGSSLLMAPESDTVQQIFRTGYQTAIRFVEGHCYRRLLSTTQQAQFFTFADCLAQKHLGECVLFITKIGRDRIVLKVGASLLLKHVASIIKFDGDSLAALSEDHRQGVLIDHNPDDTEQFYDVTIWGESWSQLAQACD